MKKNLQEKLLNIETLTKHHKDKYYVYLHLTKDTNIPFYVGKGKNNRYFYTGSRNRWWKHVVDKHDYVIKILEFNLTEQEAFKSEVFWIKFYGRKQIETWGTLVNLTDGGEGISGYKFSEEFKKQRSDYLKNNPDVWKKGINREKYFGKQLFGKDNPNFENRGKNNPLSIPVVKLDLYGKLLSIYDSVTEAALANNVAANSISAVCKGKRNTLKDFRYEYLYNYNSTNIGLKEVSKGSKQPIYQLNKDTLEIIKEYPSCAATKEDGFRSENVNHVCRGQKKTHKNYKWCFVKDYEKIKQDIV